MANWSKHKWIILAVPFLLALSTKSESQKRWGFFGHQRINRIAVFTLPPEMFGFYKEHIEFSFKIFVLSRSKTNFNVLSRIVHVSKDKVWCLVFFRFCNFRGNYFRIYDKGRNGKK